MERVHLIMRSGRWSEMIKGVLVIAGKYEVVAGFTTQDAARNYFESMPKIVLARGEESGWTEFATWMEYVDLLS